MGRRYEISDADWDRIHGLLPDQPGRHGGTAQAEAALLSDHTPGVVIADRGHGEESLADEAESRGARAVIPTQGNRKEQREVDPHLYRERNLCERFGSKVKHDRRVATRYEKKAAIRFTKAPAFVDVGGKERKATSTEYSAYQGNGNYPDCKASSDAVLKNREVTLVSSSTVSSACPGVRRWVQRPSAGAARRWEVPGGAPVPRPTG